MALIDTLSVCLALEETTGTRLDSVGVTDMTSLNGVTAVAGKVGNAAHFDDTAEQALTSSSPDTYFDGDLFTLAFWVKPGVFPTTVYPAASFGYQQTAQGLLTRGSSLVAGQYEWWVLLIDTGHLAVTVGGTGAGYIESSTAVLTVGEWAFIAMWHDGVTLRLQVNNGTIDSSAGAAFINGGGVFNIGAVGNNYHFFNGDIDQVMFFTSVLDQTDRDTLFNDGRGVDCELFGAPMPLPWLPGPSPVVPRWTSGSRSAWVIPPPPDPEEPEDTTCTDDREARVRFLLGRKMFDTRFPQALLSQNVLRGERDVAVQALAFQERTTQRLTIGVQSYALPTDYITSWALQIAKFSAGLRLYDSAGVAWYLIVTPAGDVSFASSQPSVILGTPGLRAYTLVDESLVTQYVYPSTGGAVTISTTSPGTPIQTAGVQLRDTYGTPWYLDAMIVDALTIDERLAVVASRTGSAALLPPVLEPRAMVYVDPRAFTRLDPMATDAPLYFSVWASQQLRIFPEPTSVYDIVIYYFSDGLLNCDVPRWVDVEVCWHAVRLAQIRLQHDGGARAASEFQMAGLQRMAPLYFPEYESLDAYTMPVAPKPPAP